MAGCILLPVEGLDLGMYLIRQTSKSGLGQSANEGVMGSLLTPMDRGRGKITGRVCNRIALVNGFFDAERDIRLVRSRVNQAYHLALFAGDGADARKL